MSGITKIAASASDIKLTAEEAEELWNHLPWPVNMIDNLKDLFRNMTVKDETYNVQLLISPSEESFYFRFSRRGRPPSGYHSITFEVDNTSGDIENNASIALNKMFSDLTKNMSRQSGVKYTFSQADLAPFSTKPSKTRKKTKRKQVEETNQRDSELLSDEDDYDITPPGPTSQGSFDYGLSTDVTAFLLAYNLFYDQAADIQWPEGSKRLYEQGVDLLENVSLPMLDRMLEQQIDPLIESGKITRMKVLRKKVGRRQSPHKRGIVAGEFLATIMHRAYQSSCLDDIFGSAKEAALKLYRAAKINDPGSALVTVAKVPLMGGATRLRAWIQAVVALATGGAGLTSTESLKETAETMRNLAEKYKQVEDDLAQTHEMDGEREDLERKKEILDANMEKLAVDSANPAALDAVKAVALSEGRSDSELRVAKRLLGDNEEQTSAMLAKGMTIIAAGAGSGKCVTGDTLVSTPTGTYRIDQLADHGPELHSVDAETLEFCTREGTWLDMGVSPIKSVQTASGNSIRGTHEHPLLVWNGKAEWKGLDQIEPGDHLMIRPGYARGCGHDTVIQDPEEAYLMGLFAGDGWCDPNNGHISWSRGGEYLPSHFFKLASQFWGLSFKTRVHPKIENSVSHEAWSKSTVSTLAEKGWNLSGARSKNAPDWLMASTDAVRIRFLQGLFDTDGTATGGRGFEWASASEEMARSVYQMLLGLGVVGRLKPKSVDGYDHTYWRILISGDQLRNFEDVVGFRYEFKKASDLRDLCSKDCNPNFGYPHVGSLLKQVREEWKASGIWNGGQQSLLMDDRWVQVKHYLLETRTPSRDQLLKLVAGCDCEASQTLTALAGYYLDEVKVVADAGEEHVYDFTVPGTHSFIANGIVSHNTRVMAAKVAHAIEVEGMDPEAILATSFTRASAADLGAKCRKFSNAPIPDGSDSFIGKTTHSLAFKIISSYGYPRRSRSKMAPLAHSGLYRAVVMIAIAQTSMGRFEFEQFSQFLEDVYDSLKKDSSHGWLVRDSDDWAAKKKGEGTPGLLGSVIDRIRDGGGPTAKQAAKLLPMMAAYLPKSGLSPDIWKPFFQVHPKGFSYLRRIEAGAEGMDRRASEDYSDFDELTEEDMYDLEADEQLAQIGADLASLPEDKRRDIRALWRKLSKSPLLARPADKWFNIGQQFAGSRPLNYALADQFITKMKGNVQNFYDTYAEAKSLFFESRSKVKDFEEKVEKLREAAKEGKINGPEFAALYNVAQTNLEQAGENMKEVHERMVLSCVAGAYEWLKRNEPAIFEYMGKTGAKAYDFDDLIWEAGNILQKNASARKKMQHRFKMVLVDESQDLNEAQQRLFDYVAGARNPLTDKLWEEDDPERPPGGITAETYSMIGDDKQSMYAFRSANVDNFIDRSDHYGGPFKTMILRRNYRSKQEIVEAGNHLIANNKRQIPMECYAFRGSDDSQDVVQHVHYETYNNLAASTVQEIIGMVNPSGSSFDGVDEDYGFSYGQFGIGTRTNAEADSFEIEMIRTRIPYQRYSQGFFENIVVKTLLAWIRVATLGPGPDRNKAILAAAKKPSQYLKNVVLRGIEQKLPPASHPDYLALVEKGSMPKILGMDAFQLGSWAKHLYNCIGIRKTFDRLIEEYEGNPEKAYEALIEEILDLPGREILGKISRESKRGKKYKKKVFNTIRMELVEFQEEMLVEKSSEGAVDAGALMGAPADLESVLNDETSLSFDDYMAKMRETNLVKVETLKGLFHDEAESPQSVMTYLDELESRANEKDFDEKEDAVSIVSIHSWKGLEKEHMYIVMNDTTFPKENFKSLSDSDWVQGKMAKSLSKTLEEERRVGYVAITRAKESVRVLSSGQDHVGRASGPSSFIREACIPLDPSSQDKVPGVDSDDDEFDFNMDVEVPEFLHKASGERVDLVQQWGDFIIGEGN